MKKYFLFLMFCFMMLSASAQDAQKFGYFSFDTVLKSMPEYTIAQRNMESLRSKYAAETKRVEDEFNKKYEEFLEGQREFEPTILQKRQAELQEMMEKNVAFKANAERLLKQAEADAFGPVREKLRTAVRRIGMERGYMFVLNTDNDAVPFINSVMGEDINTLLQDAVK